MAELGDAQSEGALQYIVGVGQHCWLTKPQIVTPLKELMSALLAYKASDSDPPKRTYVSIVGLQSLR